MVLQHGRKQQGTLGFLTNPLKLLPEVLLTILIGGVMSEEGTVVGRILARPTTHRIHRRVWHSSEACMRQMTLPLAVGGDPTSSSCHR